MFKQLQWQKRVDDGVVFAEVEGLRWDYYIYPQEDSIDVELSLIGENGFWLEDLTTIHKSLEAAKSGAQKHYEGVLSHHVCR